MYIIYAQTEELKLPFRFGKGSRVALEGASRKHKEVSAIFTKPTTWHSRTGPCLVASKGFSMIHFYGKIMSLLNRAILPKFKNG